MDLQKLAEYLAWLVQSELPWANPATQEASLSYLGEVLGPLAATHEGARGTLEDLAAIVEGAKGKAPPVAELREALKALIEDPNPKYGIGAPVEVIEQLGEGGPPSVRRSFPASLDPRLEETLRGKLATGLPGAFGAFLPSKPGETPANYLGRLTNTIAGDEFDPAIIEATNRWAEAIKTKHPEYSKLPAQDALTQLTKTLRKSTKPGEQGLTHLLMLNMLGQAGQGRLPDEHMLALFGPPPVESLKAAEPTLEQLEAEQKADDPQLGKDLSRRGRRRREGEPQQMPGVQAPAGSKLIESEWLRGADPLTTKQDLLNFQSEFFERIPGKAPQSQVSVLKLRSRQDPEGWAKLVRLAVLDLADQEKRGETTKVKPNAPVGTTWTGLAEPVGQMRLGVLLESGKNRPEGGRMVNSTLVKQILKMHQEDEARTKRGEQSRYWIGRGAEKAPPDQAPATPPDVQAAMLKNAAQKGAPTMPVVEPTVSPSPSAEGASSPAQSGGLLKYLLGFTEKQRADTPGAWEALKKGPGRLKAAGKLAITPAGIISLLMARPLLNVLGSLLGFGGNSQPEMGGGMSLGEYSSGMRDMPGPDELALMARAEQVRRQQQLAQSMDPRLQAALSQMQFNRGGVPGSSTY